MAIEIEDQAQPVVARAHSWCLSAVVNNLLDNAQSYGGAGIVLRVVALAKGGAEITVEADGAGEITGS